MKKVLKYLLFAPYIIFGLYIIKFNWMMRKIRREERFFCWKIQIKAIILFF